MAISTQYCSARNDKTRRVPNKTSTHKGVRALTLGFGPTSPTTENCVLASLVSITQLVVYNSYHVFSIETWKPKLKNKQYWSFFRLLDILLKNEVPT